MDQLKKKKKDEKKKSKKKNKSPTPSSLSTSSKSNSPKQIKVISKKKANAIFLREMARYASKLFEEYIPDGDIEEKLLAETPVPRNLDKVKPVDDFNILIHGRTNPYLTNNFGLEKFQKKILYVMDRLLALWMSSVYQCMIFSF